VKTNKTIICDTNNSQADISNPNHNCQKYIPVPASSNDEIDTANSKHKRNIYVSTFYGEYSLTKIS